MQKDDIRTIENTSIAVLEHDKLEAFLSKREQLDQIFPNWLSMRWFTETISDEKGLLEFCRIPRSRSEIIEFLEIASGQYALRRYLDPLIQSGAIALTIPDAPRSPKQEYVTAREK